MADGSIVFNTKIDSTNIPAEMKKVERDIEKAAQAIAKATNAKMPLVKQSEELGAKLDAAKAKAEALKKEMASIDDAMSPGADPTAYLEASAKKASVAENLKASEKEAESLQKQFDAINDRVDRYDHNIRMATEELERNQVKAAELSSQMNINDSKMSAAFTKAGDSAKKFGTKLLNIGKSALIFSVIYSGLRKIVSYTNKMLKTNEEYTAQLAQLKGALLTAFQPLYQVALPAAMAVLRVLTAVVSVIANVFSAFTGKTAAQSAKNAKALNEEAKAIGGVGSAAEEAQKSLAGFDEINALGTPDIGAGGGGTIGAIEPDFTAFDTAEYKAKIDELTVYLSGALLALGAILAFSGVNIPLGIGLMAAGAIGLVAVVKENWGAMNGELSGALGAVITLIGGALLAAGAILAFSGVNPALGLALMAFGLTSFAAATALDWNNIQKALQGPVGDIIALASGALLVLGLVLAFSGVNLPLGIALIAAGAAGLVTVGAMNWDAILQKLSQVWESIKQWFNTHVKPKLTLEYWKEKFSNIAEALEQKIRDGVNAAIALVNKFIKWLNEKMILKWSDFSVGGVKVVEAGTFKLLNVPTIPMLAQGAVLPANKPFLAMVGDQKNGTNVEAPLDTIKQALAEVMAQYGAGDVNVNISGDLAPFIRWLKVEIDRENKRVGPSLAGGNIQ